MASPRYAARVTAGWLIPSNFDTATAVMRRSWMAQWHTEFWGRPCFYVLNAKIDYGILGTPLFLCVECENRWSYRLNRRCGYEIENDKVPAGVGFGQGHLLSGDQGLDAGDHTATCSLRTFIKNGLSWDAYASRVTTTRETTTSCLRLDGEPMVFLLEAVKREAKLSRIVLR
jgi:hypothetical protein